MVVRRLLSLTLLLFSFTALADSPGFDSYPAKDPRTPLTTRLLFDNKISKKFKTVLSKEVKNGPNFARTRRLVQIGCGSGCGRIIVLDCVNGKVHDPHLIVFDNAKTEPIGERVEFKANSRLIVFRGCLDENSKKCGVFQYEQKKDELKLIKSELL